MKRQSYREGVLKEADFKSDDGMTTVDPSARTWAWPEWREWLGHRAGAGKLVPNGLPGDEAVPAEGRRAPQSLELIEN